jgi:hypothetical protein
MNRCQRPPSVTADQPVNWPEIPTHHTRVTTSPIAVCNERTVAVLAVAWQLIVRMRSFRPGSAFNCETPERQLRGHQRQTTLAVDGSQRSPLSLGNFAAHDPSPQRWKLESDPTTDLNRASETERMSALRWRSETLTLSFVHELQTVAGQGEPEPVGAPPAVHFRIAA